MLIVLWPDLHFIVSTDLTLMLQRTTASCPVGTECQKYKNITTTGDTWVILFQNTRNWLHNTEATNTKNFIYHIITACNYPGVRVPSKLCHTVAGSAQDVENVLGFQLSYIWCAVWIWMGLILQENSNWQIMRTDLGLKEKELEIFEWSLTISAGTNSPLLTMIMESFSPGKGWPVEKSMAVFY